MKLNTKKIELEMARQGINRPQFAKRLGMSPRAIHYILDTGKTKLSTIDRIADELCLDPKDLLK